MWVRALTVPMHLGLINGPVVPLNLISAQWSPIPTELPGPNKMAVVAARTKKRYLSKDPHI